MSKSTEWAHSMKNMNQNHIGSLHELHAWYKLVMQQCVISFASPAGCLGAATTQTA